MKNWFFSLQGALTLSLLTLLSELLFYCPAACRADAGVLNLANTFNLVLGVLTAVSLIPLLHRRPAAHLEVKSG